MSSNCDTQVPVNITDSHHLLDDLEKTFGLKARLSQPIINDYEIPQSRTYYLIDSYTKKYTHLLNKVSVDNLKDHINFTHYKSMVDDIKNNKRQARNMSSEEIRYKPHFIYDPFDNLEKNKNSDTKTSNLLRKVNMCILICRMQRDNQTLHSMNTVYCNIKRCRRWKFSYEQIIRRIGDELMNKIEEIIRGYNELNGYVENNQIERLNNQLNVNHNIAAPENVGVNDINQNENNENASNNESDSNDSSDESDSNDESGSNDENDSDDSTQSPRRVKRSPKRRHNRREIHFIQQLVQQTIQEQNRPMPIAANDLPEVNEEELDEEEAIKIYWNIINRVGWKNKDEGKCDLSTVQKVFRNLAPLQKAAIEAVYVILFKNIYTSLQNIMHNIHYDESTIFNIIGHICAVENWYREVITCPDLSLFIVDGELWQNFHNCMIELFPGINDAVKEAIQ